MQAKYKPWSAQQKAQLLGMVQAGRASGQTDWQAVAKQFPDRTLNQLKSMATSLRPKTPQNYKWTARETYLLCAHVAVLGKKWRRLDVPELSHLTNEQKRLRFIFVEKQLTEAHQRRQLALYRYRLQRLDDEGAVVPVEVLVDEQMSQVATMDSFAVERQFLEKVIKEIEKRMQ
ncbi:Myb-like_DNA-binding domain-containing protein [Hexamita inflata]|uniref:Myb-like DNA-binding domain-containing protein n=1 Tax=Hexamita inflata TaxID=28002 RepID=A0AA86NMH4_9EUKA|nr:Myb-like DNA-binding domain-containing protein [Hexamita inflata]